MSSATCQQRSNLVSSAKKMKLGERTFNVRRPKLGQLRKVVDALDAMAGKDGSALIDASVDLLVAGLHTAHPDLSADDLFDIETDIVELNSAVGMILVAAGLREAENAPGEAAPQPVSS